jgi:hypothetical protein
MLARAILDIAPVPVACAAVIHGISEGIDT